MVDWLAILGVPVVNHDPWQAYREKSPTRRRARRLAKMHPVLRAWHLEYERRCAQASPNAVAFAVLVSAIQALGAAALVWLLVRVVGSWFE